MDRILSSQDESCYYSELRPTLTYIDYSRGKKTLCGTKRGGTKDILLSTQIPDTLRQKDFIHSTLFQLDGDEVKMETLTSVFNY